MQGGRPLTFLSSRPKASRPMTAVTNFFLLRSIRFMVTTLWASLSACLASAASAFAVFFCASLVARFCASTEREAVAASRASAHRFRQVSRQGPAHGGRGKTYQWTRCGRTCPCCCFRATPGTF